MTHAVTSALSTITSHLPYIGALAGASALPTVATIALLLLTETGPNIKPMGSLATRIGQLAIPMFVGFLLGGFSGIGGIPGMVVAVGLSRLYRAYTTQIVEPNSRDELMITSRFCSLLADLADTTLPETNLVPTVHSLFRDLSDRSIHLQTAFRVMNLIPLKNESPLYTSAYGALLAVSFQALFKISDTDVKLRDNYISAEFMNSVPTFLSSYKNTPPRLEDTLRFAFLLKRFSDARPNAGCTNFIESIETYIVTRLNDAQHPLSLDELVQLSQICYDNSSEKFPYDPYQPEFPAVSQKLGDILLSRVTPETSPADRLKTAYAYGLVCSFMQGFKTRREILTPSVQSTWLEGEGESLTLAADQPSSLERLAILVGTGYGRDGEAIDQAIDSRFNALCQEKGRDTWVIVEGVLGLMQQYHVEMRYAQLYPSLMSLLIDEERQKQLTTDQLISCYTRCYLLPIPGPLTDDQQQKTDFLQMLQQQLMARLDCELQSKQHSTLEVTKKLLTATAATGDVEFAKAIAAKANPGFLADLQKAQGEMSEAVTKKGEQTDLYYSGTIATVCGIAWGGLRLASVLV